MGADGPGVTCDGSAWEGSWEEAARSPWEVRAGQEQLKVQFELSNLLRWLGVMRTR